MTRSILIIDDDEAIREVTRTILELVGGFEVRTAASGPEGIEIARAVRPDAVLLDVMMPGMDGPATLAALRAQPETREVPVVLLTASVAGAHRPQLTALDVAGVLDKPFDPLTLPDRLAELLGWEP